MVTTLFTVFVKLNKFTKDYTKYLMVSNESGILLVNDGLFVISFDSLEDFQKETDYKDIKPIGDITL